MISQVSQVNCLTIDPFSLSVIHTHQYFYTATTGIPNFPEFVVVGVVDGQQFVQYDSFTKRMVPKEWMANEGDSDHWNSETENAAGAEAVFKVDIGDLTSRFNQTEGTFSSHYFCSALPSFQSFKDIESTES